MQSLHERRAAQQREWEEARRLRQEAQIVSVRLKKACEELGAEMHKSLASRYEAFRVRPRAEPPRSADEPSSQRFVVAEHLIEGQRFTWTLEISLRDASRRVAFWVDDQDIGDKLQWLLRLERATQAARRKRELYGRDVVLTLPVEL